ncbi:MAG: HNH endonuclease [Bacilli bacterium]|nr:HNH endonuclease [Bacilli bacterium]
MTKSEKEVYENALKMFDNCCAICGSPYVELHHIRYGGRYGGRKTYEGNIIPLCKKHHMEAHSQKYKHMPILIKLVEEKMNGNV